MSLYSDLDSGYNSIDHLSPLTECNLLSRLADPKGRGGAARAREAGRGHLARHRGRRQRRRHDPEGRRRRRHLGQRGAAGTLFSAVARLTLVA